MHNNKEIKPSAQKILVELKTLILDDLKDLISLSKKDMTEEDIQKILSNPKKLTETINSLKYNKTKQSILEIIGDANIDDLSDENANKLLEEIKEELMDNTFSSEIFYHPIALGCGHTGEQSNLVKLDNCPLCREKITEDDKLKFISDKTIVAIISTFIKEELFSKKDELHFDENNCLYFPQNYESIDIFLKMLHSKNFEEKFISSLKNKENIYFLLSLLSLENKNDELIKGITQLIEKILKESNHIKNLVSKTMEGKKYFGLTSSNEEKQLPAIVQLFTSKNGREFLARFPLLLKSLLNKDTINLVVNTGDFENISIVSFLLRTDEEWKIFLEKNPDLIDFLLINIDETNLNEMPEKGKFENQLIWSSLLKPKMFPYLEKKALLLSPLFMMMKKENLTVPISDQGDYKGVFLIIALLSLPAGLICCNEKPEVLSWLLSNVNKMQLNTLFAESEIYKNSSLMYWLLTFKEGRIFCVNNFQLLVNFLRQLNEKTLNSLFYDETIVLFLFIYAQEFFKPLLKEYPVLFSNLVSQLNEKTLTHKTQNEHSIQIFLAVDWIKKRLEKYNSIKNGPLLLIELVTHKDINNLTDLFLGNKKLDLNVRNIDTGKTALELAAENDSFDIFSLLVSNGANPLLTDKDGKIPAERATKTKAQFLEFTLRIAVAKNNFEAVKTLLILIKEEGCNINAAGADSGNTALHLAAKNNFFDIFCFLVEQGAELTLTNKKNEKPEELLNKENKEKWEKIQIEKINKFTMN